MRRHQRGFVVAIAASVLALTGGLQAQAPESGRGYSSQDWPLAGGDWTSSRYSTLREISTDTIDRLGGEPLIEELPRRFAAVATDLRTRRAVILDRGRLGPALRASIAVPGMFSPVVTGDQILVDGGLAANLPIAATHHLGATFTIAVRLRPEWEHVPVVRSAAAIAELERRPDVLMIHPDLDGCSQWSRADVPRIIDAGYAAASTALHEWKTQQTHAA